MIYEYSFEDNKKLFITDSAAELSELWAAGFYAIPLCLNENYDEDKDNLPWPHSEYIVTDLEEIKLEDLHKIYKRLAKEPLHILSTERLTVREMTVDDVDDFYRIYSGEGITDYMEPLFDNPEDERLYTRNYIEDIYKFYDYGLWTVIDKLSGQIIGRAGISNRDGFDIPELGFVIEKDYQNKGLAYEVCSSILSYSKKELGFSKIQALVNPNNAVSLHLLKKLGFEETNDHFEDYMIMLWSS